MSSNYSRFVPRFHTNFGIVFVRDRGRASRGFQERHTRNEKKMRALTSSLANDSIPKQKTRNWVANATERSIWTYFFLFFFQTSPSPNFENLKYSKTRNRNPTQTFCTDRNQTLFMFLKKNLTCVKFA